MGAKLIWGLVVCLVCFAVLILAVLGVSLGLIASWPSENHDPARCIRLLHHALASAISSSGTPKVVLLNLRGHYLSGRRRDDVDYVGQLEDDLVDLTLRGRGLSGPVTLGGHSSGGLAIRFADARHGDLVSGYLLLSPVIPTSPTV
jgi:pimeloyl-ACP methyl ester carboxylesterase